MRERVCVVRVPDAQCTVYRCDEIGEYINMRANARTHTHTRTRTDGN